MTEATVLIVPGLRDHAADHWQTHLAARLPKARTVPPLEHDKLSCAARVQAIDRELSAIDGPVIAVAHSAGCMMLAHWAATRSRHRLHGALLATPADLETPMPAGYPAVEVLRDNGWLPIPRRRLPFPSLVAASTNDPLARLQRVAGFAQDWGSRWLDLGDVGHLNPASGHGEWPMALQLLQQLRAFH
jgi:predicted alpha/beta hydrolase family esterase